MSAAILALLSGIAPASAITVATPENGAQLTSPFSLVASTTSCGTEPAVSMGYSLDYGATTAGHLPPYLNGRELAMEGALPLGAIPGVDFPVLRFKLAESDTLILMTDGLAEAQNAAGQLFGFDRIGEMVRKGAAAPALATAAQEFGQEDDITVLTLSYAGFPASA